MIDGRRDRRTDARRRRGQRRRAAPAVPRRHLRPHHRVGGARAPLGRRAARSPSSSGCCGPAAAWRSPCPTRWPERVSWALNYRYHDTPGGHVRIYRQHELEQKLERAGPAAARLAPRARAALAVLVAEVRVRRRQHRRVAGAQVPRLPRVPDRAAARVGRARSTARSTRCSARASSSTRRRSADVTRARPARRRRHHHRGELAATVDAIASIQLADGNIPWTPGGHTDPWNLVEAAMALDLGGRHDEARARVRLAAPACSAPTAAWHAYYLGDDVEDPTLDTNVTCYVATGAWHHHLVTGDTAYLAAALADGRGRDRLRARLSSARPARSRGAATTPTTARCSPARRASTTACAARSRSPSASATSAPTGSCRSARSPSPSRTGPTCSSTRTAGRWTGTTPSSAACCAATPPHARIARRLGDVRGRGPRRALRVRPAVGHRGGDVRAGDGARRHRRRRPRAPSCSRWVQFLRADGGGYWTGANFDDDAFHRRRRALPRRAADLELGRRRARGERARRAPGPPRASSAASACPTASTPTSCSPPASRSPRARSQSPASTAPQPQPAAAVTRSPSDGRAEDAEAAGRRDGGEAVGDGALPHLERAPGRRRPGPRTRRGTRACRPARRAATSPRSRRARRRRRDRRRRTRARAACAQCAATVGELADHRDDDVLEPGVLDRAAEERQRVHAPGARGRRARASWCSHPAWFSSEPRWWSTVNSDACRRSRAAAPR